MVTAESGVGGLCQSYPPSPPVMMKRSSQFLDDGEVVHRCILLGLRWGLIATAAGIHCFFYLAEIEPHQSTNFPVRQPAEPVVDCSLGYSEMRCKRFFGDRLRLFVALWVHIS